MASPPATTVNVATHRRGYLLLLSSPRPVSGMDAARFPCGAAKCCASAPRLPRRHLLSLPSHPSPPVYLRFPCAPRRASGLESDAIPLPPSLSRATGAPPTRFPSTFHFPFSGTLLGPARPWTEKSIRESFSFPLLFLPVSCSISCLIRAQPRKYRCVPRRFPYSRVPNPNPYLPPVAIPHVARHSLVLSSLLHPLIFPCVSRDTLHASAPYDRVLIF